MSKIVLLAADGADLNFVSMVRRITGAGLGDLKAKVEGGKPFWEGILFGNDHEENAARLRMIAEAALRCGVRLEVFELEPEEAFDRCDRKRSEIDVETMRNILDAADRRRQ